MDRWRNEDVRLRVGVREVSYTVNRKVWKSFGRMERMSEERFISTVNESDAGSRKE